VPSPPSGWRLPPLLASGAAAAPPPRPTCRSGARRAHASGLARLKFDELLAQQLSIKILPRGARARRAGAAGRTRSRRCSRAAVRAHARAGARARARCADLARRTRCNRLLQGDVGSGKTVVAALAALQAIESGRQAAVMAPTEILAEQHYRKFAGTGSSRSASRWPGCRARAGRRRSARRASRAARSASRSARTRCSRRRRVRPPGPGDRRRAAPLRRRAALALREKGAASELPHQLMMSATPIPRTLAMSYYADLDVSVIDELPPGRTPVAPSWSPKRRDEVSRACARRLRAGARPTGCAR
jgi:ATP-dependent DNA helicase RecG